jgi:hypothetical protein
LERRAHLARRERLAPRRASASRDPTSSFLHRQPELYKPPAGFAINRMSSASSTFMTVLNAGLDSPSKHYVETIAAHPITKAIGDMVLTAASRPGSIRKRIGDRCAPLLLLVVPRPGPRQSSGRRLFSKIKCVTPAAVSSPSSRSPSFAILAMILANFGRATSGVAVARPGR